MARNNVPAPVSVKISLPDSRNSTPDRPFPVFAVVPDVYKRQIVDDASVYDQLKLLARFVRLAGYSGLMVCLDEMVNLYKLANTQARNSNYEQIPVSYTHLDVYKRQQRQLPIEGMNYRLASVSD